MIYREKSDKIEGLRQNIFVWKNTGIDCEAKVYQEFEN